MNDRATWLAACCLVSAGCLVGEYAATDGVELGPSARADLSPAEDDAGGAADGGLPTGVDLAGPVDTVPPTTPTGVMVGNIGASTALAAWTASGDDIGVASYEVSVDDAAPIGVTATSWNARGLSPSAMHTVKVRARDAAGNVSAYTNAVAFSTTAQAAQLPFSQGVAQSVQVTATATTAPPSLTLRWPSVSGRTVSSVAVYRKAPEAASWGAATNLGAGATSYVDNSVVLGTAYEYRVTINGSAHGYLLGGVEAEVDAYQGRVLVLVDATLAPGLTDELDTLRRDLYGEGWIPIVQTVARAAQPSSVRATIVAARQQYADLRALYLVGHVPVAYSGNNDPDGHGGRVMSADGYYAELSSTWAAPGTCATTALEAMLSEPAGATNVACNASFPSTLELEVGRVDLNDLPAIPGTELALTRGYLSRAHRFRARLDVPMRRALVKDFFESNGWNTAAGIWTSLGSVIGVPFVSVDHSNATTSGALLDGKSHLIHYGNYYGAGCTGSVGAIIGDTATVAATNWGGAFNFVFGSYFGEFNCRNSFLRAMIAKGAGLASFYNGYNWFVHRLALGRTLGDSARVTMNNALAGTYAPLGNNAVGPAGNAHLNLLGDPTLRLEYIAGPTVLVHSDSGTGTIRLDWSTAREPDLAGYHVYRVTSSGIARLTSAPLTATTFDTGLPIAGGGEFVVRAVKLVHTDAGSFYLPSVGAVSPSL